MPLETTVIGSYPPIGKTTKEQIKNAVEDQAYAGVQKVSDGQPRCDMITYIAKAIAAFKRVAEYKWEIVEKVEPSLNHGYVSKLQGDFIYLKEFCGKKAKPALMFAGPVTMAFNAPPKPGPYGEKISESIRNPELYLDTAEAILGIIQEVDPLMESAAIHIDEPVLSQGAPMGPARKAIEYLATRIPNTVNLHVCGDVTKIFQELLEWKGIDVLSHGFMGKKEQANRQLLEKYKLSDHKKMLGLGCIASDSTEIEDEDDVLDLIGDTIGYQDKNLVIHPDCGLRTLPREVAREKLKVMCNAAARFG